jgi:predicted transcriptional regulator
MNDNFRTPFALDDNDLSKDAQKTRLHAALSAGLEDIKVGRVKPAEDVLSRLTQKYSDKK